MAGLPFRPHWKKRTKIERASNRPLREHSIKSDQPTPTRLEASSRRNCRHWMANTSTPNRPSLGTALHPILDSNPREVIGVLTDCPTTYMVLRSASQVATTVPSQVTTSIPFQLEPQPPHSIPDHESSRSSRSPSQICTGLVDATSCH